MDANVEKEMCNNCKKEIPQSNYVMHTMHCSRNITLCKVCNEPIPKIEYEDHREKCKRPAPIKTTPPPINIEKNSYYQQRRAVEEQNAAARRENYLRKHEHLIDNGFTLKEKVTNGFTPSSKTGSTSSVASSKSSSSYSSSSERNSKTSSHQSATKKPEPKSVPIGGAIKKPPLIPRLDDTGSGGGAKPKGPQGLLPCRYCDLELLKLDLEEHENYCGTRTDKCLECGELVMYKNKQVHLDSNHGFVKLKDEPGPRPSWDSSTQRSASASNVQNSSSSTRRRVRIGDFEYDPMPYLPAAYQPGGGLKKKEGESYKEISRRLDWPAPQPPHRRRNPPTELVIPCEFCDTPIPHDELIEHETGCRPDLARYNPRRSRSAVAAQDEDDYTVPFYEAPRARTPRADSPDNEELPCEFCSNMVPASQLWRHQLTCTSAA